MDLRRKHGVNLVAVKRLVPSKEEEGAFDEIVNYVPTGDDIIEPGDRLVLVGKDDKVEAISSE